MSVYALLLYYIEIVEVSDARIKANAFYILCLIFLRYAIDIVFN